MQAQQWMIKWKYSVPGYCQSKLTEYFHLIIWSLIKWSFEKIHLVWKEFQLIPTYPKQVRACVCGANKKSSALLMQAITLHQNLIN